MKEQRNMSRKKTPPSAKARPFTHDKPRILREPAVHNQKAQQPTGSSGQPPVTSAQSPGAFMSAISWPDKVLPVLLALGAFLVTAGFLMAFLFAAPVNGAAVDGVELIGNSMVSNRLLLSQKIFYFHMPVALVSFAALAFAGYFSLRYLMTRDQGFDLRARVGMELALVFVLATMATGEMWTRFEWGVWWTWDPRLTTYLILTIIVIAYFVLRNAIDELERRATYAAVISIIALVDVPICYMTTRLIPSSIHPVVLREGGMSADMGLTVTVVMVGMLLTGFSLYRLRLRQLRLSQRVEAITELLHDEVAR
ncbi:MAG: cytochrome c biogenesis protein [Coriobacteriales bacterium]|jgi:heme exporter protein C|nr:cytochrome c biogenesis protein [Coriobacteriales bacterium]